MYNPEDDMNKERALALLSEFEEEDDEDMDFDISSILGNKGGGNPLEAFNMMKASADDVTDIVEDIDNIPSEE